MRQLQYTTPSGIVVTRTVSRLNYRRGLKHLLRKLDSRRGIYLSSGYEYPERYSRWDVGSLNPPMEIVARLISPVTSRLGFPTEVLPLMIVRPLSGAGALAVTADLLKTHHPDSYLGRLASIVQGSTDTTFYVLTVYFGSVGIRKTRYAASVGLLADCVGFVAALYACNWFFR